MPLSLRTLPLRLDKRFKRFEKKVDDRSRIIIVSAQNAAAGGTPVDKGRARSNWRISTAAQPPSNVIPAYAPGEKLGIGESANLRGALAQGKRVASRWRASQGKTIALFNNWDQIERLNNGEISRQGSHFVEAAQRKLLQLARTTKWLDNQ